MGAREVLLESDPLGDDMEAVTARQGGRRGGARSTNRRSTRVAAGKNRVRLEHLEPRALLAADLMIVEVATDNDQTIDDEDGSPSDWFEVYNAGNTTANLEGMHVTDDRADRAKWTFPAVELAPGESLLVFASNKDRRDPAGELHTNFRLAAGEYLALFEPDARTLVDAYDVLPAEQFEDVTYGVGQTLQDRELVAPGQTVRVLTPDSAAADVAADVWNAATFDASAWSEHTSGIGFDDDPSDGDFGPLISANGNLTAAMQGKTASAYVRSEFELPETLPTFKNLNLAVNYDDGFVAYLNGREIARVNAPDTLAWDSTASAEHGGIQADIRYDNFASADQRDDYTLLGNAAWNGNNLRLTSSAADQTSAAWLTSPVPFGADYTFSASMVYDIHSPAGAFADSDGLGGEGLVFVLQNNSNNVLGQSGGGLGLDATGSTFLAIELDSVATGSFDPDDTLPSHLGITTSADGSVARVGIPRFNGNAFFANDPGPGVNLIRLWVDYVGETGELSVYMATAPNQDKPATPTLTTTIDLAELFGGDPELYTGWTSATGAAYNAHEVLGWNIRTGVGELGREAELFDVSEHVDALQPGKNVLAIHALNLAANDEDFLLAPQLTVQEVVLAERGYFLAPSPGDLNGTSSLAPSGTVRFSHDSQIYLDPFDLVLTPPAEGAVIYYTLDGSLPDETSEVYAGPIRIDGPMRVRARAVEPGRALGRVATAGFTKLSESLVNFENNQVFSSNLPLIVFEGFDQSPDRQTRRLVPTMAYFIDPGADGRASLLDTPQYVGRAGLRSRGQSSEGWPKKQYAMELWEEGNDDSRPLLASDASDKNVSLFGMPADSDWVLNGPYSDKTQLNNFLTFNWYREIGIYAPRARLVEVFVNPDGSELDFRSDYRGTYVLLEKIKIDRNRVDIVELEPGDTEEPDITGGYIWKKDKAGAGDRPFRTDRGQELRMVEPQDPVSRTDIRPGEITEVQKDWLQNYINQFEAALYGPDFADPKIGYQAYIDVDSWVDTWLMVEMTKNIDGFRLSTYYHKDRGGKIHQGPAWDYNLSLANGNYLEGAYPEGWYGDLIGSGDYPYWDRLFEDANFAQKVADRWNELRRTLFTTENLMQDIDNAVAMLSDNNPLLADPAPGEPSNPISRNYARWTTGGYGVGVYHWPNCFFGQGGCPASPLPRDMTPNGRPNSYDDYIYIMKWFLENRVEWMDSQFAAPLEVSPLSGNVESGTQVTMTAPEGFEVYYTLDGSDPRQPVIIEEETVVFDTGTPVQVTVPADGTLIGHCDDGLRLANPTACFMNPEYTLGTNGEAWVEGTTPVGYDTEGDYTALISTDVQSQMQGVNASMYMRIPFEIDQATLDRASILKLSARYDDGFVAYVWFPSLRTPIEVARANAGASSTLPIRALDFNAAATETNPDEVATQFQDFDISNAIKYLRAGQTNYLFIQALNESAGSADFLMDFRLTVVTERVEVSPSVMRYAGPVTIDRNSHIVARGFNETEAEWTPVLTLDYIVNAPTLAITEINYNPYEPTAAELAVNPAWDNDDFEFLELKNVGTEPIGLTGISFDGITLTLGNVTLQPGEHGVVVSDAAAFAQRYGDQAKVLGEYFEGSLNNAGETIRVLDTFDNVLLEVAYDDSLIWPQTADGNGATLQLVNPDITQGDQYSKYYSWRGSTEYGGSPGAAGAPTVGVVINEVLTRADEPLDLVDAIEFYNPTTAAIDMSGWWVSDQADDLRAYQIPAGTSIAAGGYVVITAEQFGADPDRGFGLSGTGGDEVWVTTANAEGTPLSIVAHASFGAALNGESFGLDPRGLLTPQVTRTLGAENAGPRVGPIVISELNYSPSEPTAADLAIYPELGSGDLEFIEIFNPTTSEVDLTDWQIRGGVDFNFEPNEKLASGEAILVIRFNPESPDNANRLAAFKNHYGLGESTRILGGYAGGMAGTGERIALLRADTSLIGQPVELPRVTEDVVVFDDRVPWPVGAAGGGQSLHRISTSAYGNDPASWTGAAPSPGVVGFEPQAGDFDGDGVADVTDITLLFEQLQSPTPDASFDLNGDGNVNADDRDVLVLEIIGTTYGDADLNYVFDSRDLVRLFQIGEYEDNIPNNSTWDEGDWNGDGEFDSSDLLLAAQHAGYIAVPAAVPAGLRSVSSSSVRAALDTDGVLAEFGNDDISNGEKRLVGDPQSAQLPISIDVPTTQHSDSLVEEKDRLLGSDSTQWSDLDDELLDLLADA